MSDLEQWAASRAPELIARAEAEAIAVLRDAPCDTPESTHYHARW